MTSKKQLKDMTWIPCAMFWNDNNPNHTAILVSQQLTMQKFDVLKLSFPITYLKYNWTGVGIHKTKIKSEPCPSQGNASIVGAYTSLCTIHHSWAIQALLEHHAKSYPNQSKARDFSVESICRFWNKLPRHKILQICSFSCPIRQSARNFLRAVLMYAY